MAQQVSVEPPRPVIGAQLPASSTIDYFVTLAPPKPRLAVVARAADGPPTLLGDVSRRYRIDPVLLSAIVSRESAGHPSAVSGKGALGLMQVMPGTARMLGQTDPSRLLTDQRLNLETGAVYLKQLQQQFGNNLPVVLAAYNAGPGAVRRYGRVPPYAETRHYVSSIMTRYTVARGILLP